MKQKNGLVIKNVGNRKISRKNIISNNFYLFPTKKKFFKYITNIKILSNKDKQLIKKFQHVITPQLGGVPNTSVILYQDNMIDPWVMTSEGESVKN